MTISGLRLRTRADFQPVGDFYGITTYADVTAAANQTDSAADSLNTDVVTNAPTLPPEFVGSWAAWLAKWKEWKSGTDSWWQWASPSSLMEEQNGWQADLVKWQGKYQSLAKKAPTGVLVVAPPPPGKDLVTKIGDEVDSLTTALKYGVFALLGVAVIAAGVVVYKEVNAHAPRSKAA